MEDDVEIEGDGIWFEVLTVVKVEEAKESVLLLDLVSDDVVVTNVEDDVVVAVEDDVVVGVVVFVDVMLDVVELVELVLPWY